ncbi:uncharacterized protein EI90DRAFT_3257783 [Cantharellus anzutake]|uniref:uncharacterized protein n=1 Tax=Cantharellus anzutake TaxID=1750568 RepID=UPI0019073956|nr:uncharacterized protein EI90DRAFT_3257783 [Cantharellus anzutake]KAF8318550.1 hypothetical protein EI90DRAFT_3257783 [Cantharellus anzutake]
MINGSILKRSHQAELFSCILLTLAWDWASASNCIQQVPTISSKVFWTALLGDNLGLLPNDQNLKEMDNAHLNLTHMVRLTDNLSVGFLCKAWCSGAAFQYKPQQPCIDGLVLTCTGALDDPFASRQFSYIAWLSELRVDASTSDLPSELVSKESTVVFMDLHTNSGSASTAGKLFQLALGCVQHSHVPRHGWGVCMPTQDEEPPRWCIHARGHTCITYPVIERVSL